jgi:predicted DNA-binding transcriptional regulator AlpA
MSRECYFAAECAELLGMSTDAFYRQREDLHRRGMPQSKTLGRLRIPRQAFDAWLKSGKAPPPPANDDAPIAGQDDDDRHRAELARAYARP